MPIDFRECLYALSDVVVNRPIPLRSVDQIYMKLPDILLQAELISRRFSGKQVVFVGDGDAIALTLVHLGKKELLPGLPSRVTVLDFDERVVNSVRSFAEEHDLMEQIRAELYNVADALPTEHWQAFDAFHTNPPWGASNEGRSVLSFVRRGIECVGGSALGCIVIGDHPSFSWTHQIQIETQKLLLGEGFRIAEMLPEFHRYHLDDSPELTSCGILVERQGDVQKEYCSQALQADDLRNFYGNDNPLRTRYVRDLTNGRKLETRDVEMEPLNWDGEDGRITE